MQGLTAQQVTRGSLYLMGSKVVFVLSAMALNVFLARRLGPQQYGVYGVVMAFLVWLESAANPGLSVAVQRTLAEHPEAGRYILGRTVRLQLVYSVMLLLLSLLLTPLTARLLRDAGVSFLLAIASLDVVSCSLFTVYYSTLNGLFCFREHALCTVCYAIAKVFFVGLLVAGGASLAGAFVGNTLASVAGILVSRFLLRTVPLGEETPKTTVTSDLIRCGAPVTLFAFVTQLLLHLDLFMVKRLLWQQPTVVGCYVLASTLARAFHAVLQSLPTSLFPFLAHAKVVGDGKLIATHLGYVGQRMVFLVPAGALLARFLAKPLTVLFFSDAYLGMARVLPWLIVGMGLMSGLSVFASALQAMGDLKTPILVVLGCLAVAFVLHLLLIPRWQELGASSSIMLSGLLGMMAMKRCASRRSASMLVAANIAG